MKKKIINDLADIHLLLDEALKEETKVKDKKVVKVKPVRKIVKPTIKH